MSATALAPTSTSALRQLIEDRLQTAPPDRYPYPLGYVTWGADEILSAIDCLCSRSTTMWDRTAQFESEFARYLGVSDAVMVNSGSSADLVMMLATREFGLLQPHDEILIPAVTWPTHVWSALEAGFHVQLVDVDPTTLNTSPETYEAAITSRTKAIFPVHLMGNPNDMDQLQAIAHRHGLFLFEDCCEALGASFDRHKLGTFGVASAFSFFASHHISTLEGGMIATNNPSFADQCRLIRAHGWARDQRRRSRVEMLQRYSGIDDDRYLFLGMGFNFRPTELNAAFGSLQLQKLDALNTIRNRNADVINVCFRNPSCEFIEPLHTCSKSEPAWFALPFVLRKCSKLQRPAITRYLHDHGVDTRPLVGGNLARHPAFWRHRQMIQTPLCGADAIHHRGFYLGLPPIEDPIHSLTVLLNGIGGLCASR